MEKKTVITITPSDLTSQGVKLGPKDTVSASINTDGGINIEITATKSDGKKGAPGQKKAAPKKKAAPSSEPKKGPKRKTPKKATPGQITKFLAKEIADAGFPARAIAPLTKAGITTVEKLLGKTALELNGVEGLGKTNIAKIKKVLLFHKQKLKRSMPKKKAAPKK